MTLLRRAIVFSLMGCFCASVVARAQVSARIESMKLLTPNVGWATTGAQLFWTNEGGSNWHDITPQNVEGNIVSVFFLDEAYGWILFSHYDEPQPVFHLAATEDSGAHWTVTRLNTSGIGEATLAGNGEMYFLDKDHGWLNLAITGSAAANRGAILATQDGGKSWRLSTASPGSGEIMFIDLKDGWVLAPGHSALFVTHDGSSTWQTVSPRMRDKNSDRPAEIAGYEMPAIASDGDAFLVVTLAGSGDAALFRSTDRGTEWKLEETVLVRSLTHTMLTRGSSEYLTARIRNHILELTTTQLNGSQKTGNVARRLSPAATTLATVTELSFQNATNGWAIVTATNCTPTIPGCSHLLATQDGGASWRDITPSVRKSRKRATSAQILPPTGGITYRPLPTSFGLPNTTA